MHKYIFCIINPNEVKYLITECVYKDKTNRFYDKNGDLIARRKSFNFIKNGAKLLKLGRCRFKLY